MFELFDKAKCFVGAHDWGQWKYETSGSCHEIRICKRSGCTENETREQHIWSKYDYETEHSCQQIRTCTRCGEKEKRDKKHTWGEWKYVTLDSWQQYITRLRKIRHLLATRFAMSEVETICLDLGISPENLPGETKSDKARELVKYLELHHQVDELIRIASEMRPDICWDEMEISSIISVDIDNEKLSIDQISWEFNPSESCNQIHKCSRCGEIEKRNQHRWSDKLEYESPSSCTVARYCKRCGEKHDDGVKHEWEEWVASTTECIEVRVCRRCRIKEIGSPVPHSWGKWDFETPISCILVRTCARCGKEERNIEDIKHKWGDWDYESPISCKVVRKCIRCGESEYSAEEIKHKWSDWKYEAANSCNMVMICQRCDKNEIGTAKHKWGDWETVTPSSPMRRSCKKCGKLDINVTGVWTGIMKLKEDYFCDIYLEQIEDSIKGIFILAYYNNKDLSIVKQPIEGKIDGKKLDFSGMSYSFVRKGASNDYNLDMITGEITASGEKITGKVTSSSSGTIELNFARVEPCSHSNVSGLWDGMARWNNGQEDRWDLFFSEGNSAITGTLIVTAIQDKKIAYTVEQQVIGELSSNQSISFKGVSGRFIYSSKKIKYSFDNLNGLIMDDSGTIKGDIMSGNRTGTVVLKLVRNKS